MNIINLILLLLIFSVMMGYIVKSYTDTNKQIRIESGKMWHSLGVYFRVLLILYICTHALSIVTITTLLISLGVLLIHWMPYDCILNCIRFKKMFYDASVSTGTTSFIDKLLNGKLYYASQIVAIIIGILLIIFANNIDVFIQHIF